MGVDGPILLTQSVSITAATRPQLPGGPGLPKNCPIFPAFRLRPPAWGEGDKTQRQNCPHPSTNILSEKSDNGLTYKTLSSQIWSLFSSLAFVSLRWWMIDPGFKKTVDNNVSDRLDRGERKTGPILEFEVLPWINLNLDLEPRRSKLSKAKCRQMGSVGQSWRTATISDGLHSPVESKWMIGNVNAGKLDRSLVWCGPLSVCFLFCTSGKTQSSRLD